MEAAVRDLRLEDEELPDSKATPSTSSPELKAAGSAPGPYSRDLVAMAAREEVMVRDLLAMAAREDPYLTNWAHGVDPAPSSANLEAAGSASYSRDLVAADLGEVMARDIAMAAREDPSWLEDWEHSLVPAPFSSNSSTAKGKAKGKVSGSSVYLAVAPSPLQPRYASWHNAKGLAGVDYSWRPRRQKVRSPAARRYLAPLTLVPSGEESYSRDSRVDSFSEPNLPDTVPGTIPSSGYLAPSPLLPSGEGSYSYDSRVESFSEPCLPDTVPRTVPSSGYLAPSPVLPSFEESEEPLDKRDVHFNYLVETFIAMAYPQGMNGAGATGPGQQEDTTIPSASAPSMEALAAMKGTKLDGARSGKSVRRGMVTHERWTWKNQKIDDGPEGLRVVSPSIKQIMKDSCTPTATKAVLESNLRVQQNEDSLLSQNHLNKLSDDSAVKHRGKLPVERMFLMVQSQGVLSEADFENPQNATAARYHITKFRYYTIGSPEHIKYALYKLREGGPLMGVIRISKNYDDCVVNGDIYKYDPHQEFEKDGKPEKITHAVCIISFGIEGYPYLEAQNSHGEKFKSYLKFDVTSLCQLWSIECERRECIQGAQRYPLPGVRRAPQVPLESESAVPGKNITVLSVPGSSDRFSTSALIERLPSRWPIHAPWKNYRVISGHLGWVRSIAFDPGNEWFCTGSADRTIKIWDLASGTLKLTLTGHIEQVRGLAVSQRHTYLFSAGDDKHVKCWDLEQKKVIRSYDGHLSGVYCLALHPTFDVLLTGGRDSVCRVWDIRTKAHVCALTGHNNTVCSVFARPTDPQVVTGSHDKTIKFWDLVAGKTMRTLAHHKKSVRAMALHPNENSFASASADNIKKFSLPKGEFLHNMLSQQKTILNAMAVNKDGVLATAGDNGSMWFWDWKSGHNFQQEQTIVQPGSLDSEACIYALSYDNSGSRLVTCEADNTVKMWKEDPSAVPETYPVNFGLPKDIRRY